MEIKSRELTDGEKMARARMRAAQIDLATPKQTQFRYTTGSSDDEDLDAGTGITVETLLAEMIVPGFFSYRAPEAALESARQGYKAHLVIEDGQDPDEEMKKRGFDKFRMASEVAGYVSPTVGLDGPQQISFEGLVEPARLASAQARLEQNRKTEIERDAKDAAERLAAIEDREAAIAELVAAHKSNNGQGKITT